MAAFQYERLPEPDSIRLLILEPSAEHSSQIRCSLVHTTLARYKNNIVDQDTAISYVWGDPKTSRTIFVNGETFHVATNLFNALRDLRDDHRIFWLWIDAICIDQANVDERNRQVNMMGSIYTLTQHTAIYLGVSFPGSNSVLEALSVKNTTRDPITDCYILQFATSCILSRPWFTRVWIFQELVLSRDPWIQCGRCRTKWDDFCANLETLKDKVNQAGREITQPGLHKVLQEMQHTRGKFRAANLNSTVSHPALIDVLHSRRGFGASDPRDRVFAHLGIAAPLKNNMLDLKIKVDYGKCVSEVYTNPAVNIILSAESLEILRFAERVSPAIRSFELPSWVPDWSLSVPHDPKLLPQAPPKEKPPNKDWSSEEWASIMAAQKQPKFLRDAANSPTYNSWLQHSTVLVVDCLQKFTIRQVSPAIPAHGFGINIATEGSSSVDSQVPNNTREKACHEIYNTWREKKGFEPLPRLPMPITKRADAEMVWPYYKIKDNKPDLASHLLLHSYKQGAHSTLTGRSIASFKGSELFGQFGLVPTVTKPGDLVCHLWPYRQHRLSSTKICR